MNFSLKGYLLLVAFMCQVKTHEVQKPCIVLINNALPRDCDDVFNAGKRTSGVYLIQPHPKHIPFKVYCDITKFEAWTVILSRFDGSVNFNRSWSCYKNGFGDLNGEHWLGNDHIFEMTNWKHYKLRVELSYWTDGKYEVAEYSTFWIQSEIHKYKLHIGGYSSCKPGWDGLTYSNGMNFSTFDQDNDAAAANCALHSRGGFWFKACKKGNPTGLYQEACTGTQAYKCVKWARKPTKTMVLKIAPRDLK